MSELMGGDESFLWETQSCWGISNPDNSGCSEEKSGKKMPNSTTSKSQQPALGFGKSRSGGPKKGHGVGEVNECGDSDHEVHIWTERERRKKMRNMFSNLHALLPQLAPKADKSTIVDEAVSYIKSLQDTLQKLQKQKLESLHGRGVTTINYDIPTSQKLAMETREAFLADQGSSTKLAITTTNSPVTLSTPHFPTIFQTWTSPNVTLNVCGEDAQICVCSAKKPGLFTAICNVLEMHQLEVVSAHVSSDNTKISYMIQARASRSNQFLEAFPVEEICKQAATEIMFWVNS